MLDHSHVDLTRAVLQTLAYADVFDYPLTAAETHRYLTGMSAPLEAVEQSLKSSDFFTAQGEYFALRGREEIIPIRLQREAYSKRLLPHALRYGRVLGSLPYVRMVALTGSLAVKNASERVDFDYLLITAPGRLWLARACALAFNRLTRLRGHTLCPNLLLSEDLLEWPTHDLYSARELCQMMPITGLDVYIKLMNANPWVSSFLPNVVMDSNSLLLSEEKVSPVQKLLELPLRGKIGDRLEAWEMTRKIARFQEQAGFGEETIFNADICQGNFDHHRAKTRRTFQQRLKDLDAVSPLPLALSGGRRPKTKRGEVRTA